MNNDLKAEILILARKYRNYDLTPDQYVQAIYDAFSNQGLLK